MKSARKIYLSLPVALFATSIWGAQFAGWFDSPNPNGIARTVITSGVQDSKNPFFRSLGTNGRACVTCHQPSEGWSVSVAGIQDRFDRTKGLDPIFRLVDGANSPLADVGTPEARRDAYSMLLNRGVFRVERPMPDNAEFELIEVDDPYGYASEKGLSLFRRPLPTTNLRFISTVMWDGREVDPNNPMRIENDPGVNHKILLDSLSRQALDATNGHAEANRDITQQQREQIVQFELGLVTAQVFDNKAGSLTSQGALGGPENILKLPFYIGINDNVRDPNGPFDPTSMTLYEAWLESKNPYQRAIARGQEVFCTMPIVIESVKGINDNPYFGSPPRVVGTCTTCHNTPNVGNHSVAIALDIGLADASRRTKDMPLYTFQNRSTGEFTSTMDPGLALSTGKWKDIGRFKGAILRGLSARAPYFHDGSAKDLGQVVDFYIKRFKIQMSKQQRSDLVAFLQAL